MPRLAAAVAALVLAALAFGGAAVALPGDPPVEPLTPAEGAAVPADPAGISVGFTCPVYREQVYGDPEDPFVDQGGPGDYLVRFSRSAATGPDGLLADKSLGSDAGARDNGDGTCGAVLDTYDSADSPELVGGRVFWQVHRPCIGCEGQRPESGPVRSFDVRASVDATFKAPKRVYGGYLAVFAVRSKASLSGARVVLQRRAGKRFKTIADEAYLSDETPLYAKLPAGRQTVRAVIRTRASSFTVATRKLTVRRAAGRTTSRRDDGRYRNAKRGENDRLELVVGGGGRTIRRFAASVTTFCVGLNPQDNRLFIASALLKNVKVAPDGSVAGVLRAEGGGREVLTGTLKRRQFKGRIDVSLSTCNGSRKFTAVRR